MRAVFRVDASLLMGTGHVMRSLTLADILSRRGVDCQFICREHPGNLIEYIRAKGYIVHVLLREKESSRVGQGVAHAAWLGATPRQDIKVCRPILNRLRPDWLIVDHYALNAEWERALRPLCRRLMVIDDLADRVHECDLLLDQSLGRQVMDYRGLVPQKCVVLGGTDYALLRPEFNALRQISLRRRKNPQLRNLLISMGGVDHPNATGRVLEALRLCSLPADCRITIAMGPAAPWLAHVRELAGQLPMNVELLVNVADMATLMSNSDLSIGAAGSTSWERCCLGLPSIIVVLADNQKHICSALEKKGAAIALNMGSEAFSIQLRKALKLCRKPSVLKIMAEKSASLCDGLGAERAGSVLLE